MAAATVDLSALTAALRAAGFAFAPVTQPDPDDPNRVEVRAAKGDRVCTWQAVWVRPGTETPDAFALSGDVWLSDDGGATWTPGLGG